MTRYLVIGNSAGGVGAAEAIREVDRRGPLTVVSEEPYPAYSRPQISRYLQERYPSSAWPIARRATTSPKAFASSSATPWPASTSLPTR